MKKERILKKKWEAFLRDFNNKYALQAIKVQIKETDQSKTESVIPLGFFLYKPEEKKIELWTIEENLENPAKMFYALFSIRAIYALREGNNLLGLEIHSARGPKLCIRVLGENLRKKLIEKLAYELFLKRGQTHGHDLEDWLEAEKILLQALNDR